MKTGMIFSAILKGMTGNKHYQYPGKHINTSGTLPSGCSLCTSYSHYFHVCSEYELTPD